jgi:peptide/nickel transport system substrate-binding protein
MKDSRFAPLTRRILLGASALAMLLTLGLAPALAQGQKTLTIGIPIAPLSLDPSVSGNGRAGAHLLPAYEPLVRERADGSMEPALAASWKVAPDNKEVTFTLRKDAKFSDGEPVTAAAVKKSFEYWRSKKGPFTVNFLTVTAVDVLDDAHLSVKLSESQPSIVGLFNGYWNAAAIISPKGVDNPAALGTQTFGAGPYKLDVGSTITRKSYVYVKNEHYYDKKRQLWDKIVMTVFEDQNSAIQSMKAGQTQVLISDPITANANVNSLPPDIRLVSEPIGWTGLIFLDRDGKVNPVLKDVRVRQAINMALNRPLIGRALFGKFIEPSVQLQGLGFLGYDAANEDKYLYSLEKAKALLTQAGHPDGITFSIGYVNSTLNVTLVQAIVAQLKRAGITAKTTEYQGFGPMIGAFNKKEAEVLLFATNFGPPNVARFQTLMPKGSLNPYESEDAEMLKFIKEATSLSVNKSEAAWKKVYARVVDLAWFAPIGAAHGVYFVSDKVKMPKMGASLVVDVINMEPAK